MPAKFTPADIVRRYRESGVLPRTGHENVVINPETGRWELRCKDAGCCAMGIAVLDEPWDGVSVFDRAPQEPRHADIAKQLGVNYSAFASGFDGNGVLLTTQEQRDSYELGKACREAVLAAGYKL